LGGFFQWKATAVVVFIHSSLSICMNGSQPLLLQDFDALQ